MKHYDFSFPDKNSRRKNTSRALNYFLFYIVGTIALLYFFALAEPAGGMTDYEFIYKISIFIGAPLIGAVVFAVWCIRIFRSKSIGVNIYEEKLEIVRYSPLGFTFRLKIAVPFTSIERIEISAVTPEITKNTQCQIYMPEGSECVIIKTVDKSALSFCTEDNSKFIAEIMQKIPE